MKKLNKVLIIFISLLVSSVALGALSFKKESGEVEFKAKGWPSLLIINGKGEGFAGDLSLKDGKLSGELSFELKSLKTGIDLRDDHLKNKYLKIAENPLAILKVKDLVFPSGNKGKLKFSAELRLNGVSRAVAVVGKLHTKGETLKVNAQFKIKLSDFKIAIPSFKGITVAEDVEIKVISRAVFINELE